MVGDTGNEYYAALIASGVSLLGWLATAVVAFLTLYYVLTDGPVLQYAQWTVVAFAVAVGFALLEKRLYRIGDEN